MPDGKDSPATVVGKPLQLADAYLRFGSAETDRVEVDFHHLSPQGWGLSVLIIYLADFPGALFSCLLPKVAQCPNTSWGNEEAQERGLKGKSRNIRSSTLESENLFLVPKVEPLLSLSL